MFPDQPMCTTHDPNISRALILPQLSLVALISYPSGAIWKWHDQANSMPFTAKTLSQLSSHYPARGWLRRKDGADEGNCLGHLVARTKHLNNCRISGIF